VTSVIRRLLVPVTILTLAAAATAAGCGNGRESVTATAPAGPGNGNGIGSGNGGGATTTLRPVPVGVVLEEYTMVPTDARADSGEVTFEVTNNGYLPHRLVVIDTELDYFALPKTSAGALDVDSYEIEILADTGDIAPGATARLTVTLGGGTYVLADPGTPFVTGGMRAPFTVTGGDWGE
jgi:hypothetical protein